MLSNNSLAPCIPRLACSSWKLGNASGHEANGGTGGLIIGAGVDLDALEGLQ